MREALAGLFAALIAFAPAEARTQPAEALPEAPNPYGGVTPGAPPMAPPPPTAAPPASPAPPPAAAPPTPPPPGPVTYPTSPAYGSPGYPPAGATYPGGASAGYTSYTPSGSDQARAADPRPADGRRHRVNYALLAAGAGVELAGRSFHYTLSPANTANIRPYDIFPAPMLWFGGELYPAALTGVDGFEDVGIAASYAHAFGVNSNATNGRPFSTSWTRLLLGARYRIRTGDRPSSALVGLGLGYGRVACIFTPEESTAVDIAGEVPSVDYEFLRPSIDLRLPVGPIALLGGLAYLGVVSAGEVYNRFTDFNRSSEGDATLGAVELALGASVEVTRGLEARLGFEYQRYFYSFSPEPGDQYVAGGALDQIYGARAAAVYVY